MESPDGTGLAAADGGLGVVDRGPPVPACHAVPWTPYRGGASTYALGASESRSQIDDTSHAYNICSSIQLLNINATSYDLFCNAVFFAYAQPIDWVGRGRLKMRDMKIRDGQKCRGGKCET